MQLRRVVVTGLGALTPLGNTVPEYWNGLINGVSGANLITRFDASKFKTRFACEVKGLVMDNFIERKEARKMDLFTQFAMVACDEALKDSGIDLPSLNMDRIGVIWGSGIGGLITFQEEVKSFAKGDGTPRFNPFFIPKMIPDLSAGHIAIKYGFRGPNYATVSACASSSNSIYDAFTHLRLGKAVRLSALPKQKSRRCGRITPSRASGISSRPTSSIISSSATWCRRRWRHDATEA